MLWLKYGIWSVIFISGVVGIVVMKNILQFENKKMPPSFWAYVAWIILVEIVAFVLYFMIF